MTKKTNKTFDIPLLKRVMAFVKPYRSVFWLTALVAIVLSFLSPARPMLIQYAFDNYIMQPDLDGLWTIILFLIALLLVESVLQFFYTFWANHLGQSVIKDIRQQVFRHILAFKQKHFDNTPIGSLVTRVVSDVEAMADIFSQGLLVIIGDLLKLLVVVVVMFVTDWRLSLLSLASIPVLLVVTNWFKKSVKSAFQEVRTQVSALNTFVQEHIVGMSVVQLFVREEQEFEKFKKINAVHRDAHIRSIWYYSIFFPAVELLSAISIGLLIWWGGIQAAVSEEVTLGELVAFILYIHMLFRPIRQLADRFNVLQMGMVASERIFDVLDLDEQISDQGDDEWGEAKGDISFEDVWFAYNEEDWVLKGLSFEVKAGQTLALVGSTGSGKSSIINVLTRSYELNKGEVCIDGQDFRKLSLASLRSHMSLVLQDVFLFSDSLLNNITLHQDISLEQVREAAKEIGVHDFISSLPGGYKYEVKERGAMLSAGQRQLLSFLRAYVHNPKVLILDEATSSVDSETEQMMQKATEKLMQGRTSIVIAHRLATIQKADKILLLEHGQIEECGTHQELMALGMKYKTLFDLQFEEALKK
jgi:ATP-binding cassette subfamily B protein